MSPTTTKPNVVRITVNLPRKVWEVLEQIAETAQVSKTEALRRAISTEHFRMEVEEEHGELLVKRKDGTLEKVNFPY